jgi:hypothetical protein
MTITRTNLKSVTFDGTLLENVININVSDEGINQHTLVDPATGNPALMAVTGGFKRVTITLAKPINKRAGNSGILLVKGKDLANVDGIGDGFSGTEVDLETWDTSKKAIIDSVTAGPVIDGESTYVYTLRAFKAA